MLFYGTNNNNRHVQGWGVTVVQEAAVATSGRYISETHEIYHGGFFLKLAQDNVQIKNPKDQNWELRGF